MRFMILTTDYTEFLDWLYAENPGLNRRRYEEQMLARLESLFPGPHVYSTYLRELGHESYDFYTNNRYMQKAWLRETGFKVKADYRWEFRLRRGIVPWFSRMRDEDWFYDSLATQIRYHKPDVLLNHDMYLIRCNFLKEMKPYVRLLMGQHAGPPLPTDLGCYDLFISSFQPYVDQVRHMGVPAELHRLGFDPAWLSCMDGEERPFDTTFIGSFHPSHRSRVALLEVLCSRFPQVKVWTPRVDQLAPGSSIRSCYQGVAWGREMYKILSRSKITLNHHGDVLPYANNIRLYEATAMGAMLITDWKENLPEMFEPGKEVVAYRSPEECAELIQYYQGHDAERKAIAHAGQQRTLQEHTYARRMRELTEIVSRYYPRN